VERHSTLIGAVRAIRVVRTQQIFLTTLPGGLGTADPEHDCITLASGLLLKNWYSDTPPLNSHYHRRRVNANLSVCVVNLIVSLFTAIGSLTRGGTLSHGHMFPVGQPPFDR
jgi:hypothetical protein